MARSRSLLLAPAFLLLALPAAAISLVGVARGEDSPGRATTPEVVANGDFSIFRIGDDGSTVGDGVDEHTFWLHDFTGDPALSFFAPGTALLSATLDLTLTPAASPVADRAAIFGLREFRSPLFDAIPIGETRTVRIDLRSIYSDAQILAALHGNTPLLDARIPPAGAGQLTLGYANDAIVSFARIEIAAAPEPDTAALVAVGLLWLGARGRTRLASRRPAGSVVVP